MKHATKNNSRRFYRSPVGKGMNLGTRVERQGRGKGAYTRKAKYRNTFTD